MAAVYYFLPLQRVTINTDGSGTTQYSRRLGTAEIESWAVTMHAGPLAEMLYFGAAPVGGDDAVASAALSELGLDWNAARMSEFRDIAARLVRSKRGIISRLANELVRRRVMSGTEVYVLLAGPNMLPPPLWVA